MRLQDWFDRQGADWATFGEYIVIRSGGKKFDTPAMTEKVAAYDPLKVVDEIVADALNVGIMCVGNNTDEAKIESAILDFCGKYGLLGFMTALPTTPDFWEDEFAHIPKNPIMRPAKMPVKEYVDMFFPPEKAEMMNQKAKAMQWLLGDLIPGDEPPIGIGDRETYALQMKFRGMPSAQKQTFLRGYAEPYEWLHDQFCDWATMLCAVRFYHDEHDDTMRELHRRAMFAFGGIAPHYRVVFDEADNDKPKIKWDFHSLLQTIQMILSFALTDEAQPLRICKECSKVYLAADPRSQFCSHDCKNRYGVRKSRHSKQERDSADE
jgi:hypothetical protein